LAQSGTGDLTVGGLGTFAGGLQTNAITPATGTSLALGEAGITVSVPGDLIVGGTLAFTGGIETDAITPATAGKTVTIPGSGASSTAIGDRGKSAPAACWF
jgi:hypothetical protein